MKLGTPEIRMRSSRRRIPDAVRNTLRARLEDHAASNWARHCRSIVIRFRGEFAYIDAYAADSWAEEGDQDVPVRLCRLGFMGDPERWAFAFFKYSDETYEPSVVFSGSFEATPEEAFDCAASVYLGR